MKKELIKLKVCSSCLSPDIFDVDCICVYQKVYDTVELEFEKCPCCGDIASQPANTIFNHNQLSDEKIIS